MGLSLVIDLFLCWATGTDMAIEASQFSPIEDHLKRDPMIALDKVDHGDSSQDGCMDSCQALRGAVDT